MNTKNHIIEIFCDHKQATDVAKAIIHSIVFFRSFGKFTYKHESSYSIGSLGFEQVDCQSLNFTYIRGSSSELASAIDAKLLEFTSKLDERLRHAILLLEFYTKKPNRWPFNDTKIVWESWTVKITFTHAMNQNSFDRQFSTRSNAEEALRRIMIDIVTLVNTDRPFPQMPTQSDFENTFDASYVNLQPYLFSLSWKICDISDKHASGQSPKDISIETTEPRRSSITRFLLGTLEL